MKYAFALLVTIGLLGCKSSTSPDDTPQSGEIKPLKVGNFWRYEWRNYSEYGLLLQTQALTERLERDSLIGAERWYVISYESLEVGQYLVNRSDGLYSFDADDPFLGQAS
jgi:hypothetical protein